MMHSSSSWTFPLNYTVFLSSSTLLTESLAPRSFRIPPKSQRTSLKGNARCKRQANEDQEKHHLNRSDHLNKHKTK